MQQTAVLWRALSAPGLQTSQIQIQAPEYALIHLSGAVCRPDAITAPDLDQLFGGHLNLALMHPFATSIQLDQAPVGAYTYC